MKRFLVLLLACILVFSIMVSISACKPKPTPDKDDTTPGDGTDVVVPGDDDESKDGPANYGDGISGPPASVESTPVIPGEETETEGGSQE